MGIRIGDILVAKKIITPQQLESAIAEQKRTKEMLGQVLIKLGFVSERTLLEILGTQQGITFVELKDVKIAEKVLKSVPAKFVWHYKIMPINLEGNVLTVAISNPFDMWPLDDLETNLGFRTEKVLATSVDIEEAIKRYYGVGAEVIESLLSEGSKEEAFRSEPVREKVEDLEKMAGDASVVKLVNQVLHQAIKDRATDIHIENFRDELILRYRIDGILYDTQVSDDIKYFYSAIVSRIKVMSGLDIIERRLPQDGRVKVKIGDNEYDLRISIIPTIYGENVVLRILPTTMLFKLSDLGMHGACLETLEELIKKPHGIIFVTGPTGSGKSTTLYACLSKLNTRERKIITIEDPAEYALKGVSQIQINAKIGLTFAAALRSVLRHDPDIIMVGEVRDFETAEITIQTALTGHLVFSTLHTNDAASAVTRLIDMNIDPFLVASSVEAFVAQRLVRVVCDKCKVKENIPDDIKETLSTSGVKFENKAQIFTVKGCKSCNHTGYIGRTGIYEILPLTEEIRKLVLQRTSSDIIKKKAIERGMRTLWQDGWERVLAGVTTTQEVMRVTQQEK